MKSTEKSQDQIHTDSADHKMSVAKKKYEPPVRSKSKYEIDDYTSLYKVDYLSDLIESGKKGPSNDLAVYQDLSKNKKK